MSKVWFVAQGNSKAGPYAGSELKAMALAGQIQPETLIWKEGLAKWIIASSVKGLFDQPAPSSPPAAPAQTHPGEGVRGQAKSSLGALGNWATSKVEGLKNSGTLPATVPAWAKSRRLWLRVGIIGGAIVATSFLLGIVILIVTGGRLSRDGSPKDSKIGELRQWKAGHAPGTISFLPDGSKALSSAWNDKKKLILWDIETGKEIRTFDIGSLYMGGFSLSPDGQLVATTDSKGLVLWNVSGGDKAHVFKSGGMPMGFSGDGALLYSWHLETEKTGPDGAGGIIPGGFKGVTVRVLDVKKRQEVRSFQVGGGSGSWGGYCSPGGKQAVFHFLANAAPDKSFKNELVGSPMRLVDLETGQELHDFGGQKKQIKGVAISSSGSVLTEHEGGEMTLWEIATGKEIRTLNGYRWPVAFSPDGQRALAVIKDTNTLVLLDVAAGKELQRFDGHTDSVLSVCFSPAGGRALSGSKDGTLRLWGLPK
jgi:hypothetical protein